jgi:hypothetical protein
MKSMLVPYSMKLSDKLDSKLFFQIPLNRKIDIQKKFSFLMILYVNKLSILIKIYHKDIKKKYL